MSESVPPLSILELDQLDIFARIQNDVFFVAGVPVLLQLKGITERDVAIKIGTVNQSNGLVGSVVIVLMPTLRGRDPDAPGPRYDAIYEVQVIDNPILRRQQVGGTQQSADEIADRLRQILHRFTMGRGQTIYFSSMKRVTVDEPKNSYIVGFNRTSFDQPPPAVASVKISVSTAAYPNTVTLTCGTPGASMWYTIDGSYPGSNSVACPTAIKYTGPFTAPPATVIRAAAEVAGFQQSQAISQVTLAGDFGSDFGPDFQNQI